MPKKKDCPRCLSEGKEHTFVYMDGSINIYKMCDACIKRQYKEITKSKKGFCKRCENIVRDKTSGKSYCIANGHYCLRNINVFRKRSK